MKVFVSWSGALSERVAEILHERIPVILHTADVFYSPKDINKGEGWDERLGQELSASSFGIVCLTAQNISAPWLHFEAGALSNKHGSRVATILIDIVPSQVVGPLTRFQATKLEMQDFCG